MTKIATATTVMRLLEREVRKLDAPVAPLVSAMRSLKPADWVSRKKTVTATM